MPLNQKLKAAASAAAAAAAALMKVSGSRFYN